MKKVLWLCAFAFCVSAAVPGAVSAQSSREDFQTIVVDSLALIRGELRMQENEITSDDVAFSPEFVVFCGENDENGTAYFGPATAAFGGDGSDASIASTACDALDSGTEATADAPIFTNTAFKVMGFWCKTDGTLGADESITFTFRSAAASTTPALTCTISTGESDCAAIGGTTTDIAAGATVAMRVVQASDNADDNAWCRAAIALK